ncbi:hypothetical protein [Bradyrhizobium sp. Leo121]|uniref:hypothetical protein n=1 Tax=Bradyrhizobium sp. Leo121 TaxID=1571195 RepID=UPI00102A359A|nr:hypothetical protein [Bradyrhizobium sp. Leo121]RZN11598.1 hypothetical protein CWO90_46350 [Bradyrhizobium sp. Leo121]
METKRKRNRAKQTTSLQARLVASARQARTQARDLPPGAERQKLLRQARQAEQAADMNEFLSLGTPK